MSFRLGRGNGALFEMKMPIWYTRRYLDKSGDIAFCEMKYTERYGGEFSFSSVVGHPEPGCEVI